MTKPLAYVPPIIQEMVDKLAADTGVAPTVRKYVTGYLMEHRSEHVYMNIHYKKRSGKWAWCGSTLELDGVKQAMLAHDYDDYVGIFKAGKRVNITEGAPVLEERPVYEPVDETEAPATMREELVRMRNEARQSGGNPDVVHLARHGEDYLVVADTEALLVTIPYRQFGDAWRSTWETDLPIAVLTHEGVIYDVSEKFRDLGYDMGRLLAAMGHELPRTDIQKPIHRHAEPKRLNSVEVRRTTVIRV